MKGEYNMEKKNLVSGICMTIVGLAFLVIALTTEMKLDGILAGFGSALFAPGILRIRRYRHWNKPENREKYQEMMEKEQISLHDELNVQLRDKAGRYTFWINFVISAAGTVILVILKDLEVIILEPWVFKCLAGYIVFQVVAYVWIFYKLLDKYTD